MLEKEDIVEKKLKNIGLDKGPKITKTKKHGNSKSTDTKRKSKA